MNGRPHSGQTASISGSAGGANSCIRHSIASRAAASSVANSTGFRRHTASSRARASSSGRFISAIRSRSVPVGSRNSISPTRKYRASTGFSSNGSSSSISSMSIRLPHAASGQSSPIHNFGPNVKR